MLVAHDDPALQTVGRVRDDGTGVGLFWPGSAVILETDAPTVEVLLDDETGDNYLAVVVDGAAPVVVGGVKGPQRLPLAEGLRAGVHRIELHKRTEGLEGTLWVRGFSLPEGGSLTRPDAPRVRLEFYGDSITSGYALDCPSGADQPIHKNHYGTYAAIATRALGGQHHSISISGVGLVRSWEGDGMARRWAGYGFGDQDWDFALWPADVVVVNLGQNDHWLGVSAARIQAAYVAFAAALRARHPGAPIVLALGGMSAASPASGYPGALRAAVGARNRAGDQGVHALIFDVTADGHPGAPEQERMAAQLLAAFGETLGLTPRRRRRR